MSALKEVLDLPGQLRLLSAVTGVLLALGIGIGVRLEKGYPPGLPPKPFAHLVGKPAPSFEVEGLDSRPVSLQSANGADSWLLFFTDSGCKACDATYSSLEQAARRLPVVIIGVGDRQLLKNKLTQHNITVVVGYDSLQVVKQAYQVNGFPSVLLIDKQGIVRRAEVGSKSIEEIMGVWDQKRQGGVR